MNYKSPFRLDKRQRETISPADLALHILKVLQHNFQTSEWVSYGKGCLPGILSVEIYSREPTRDRSDREFEHKWAEAVQHLRNRNLVISDPGQQSPEFAVLTAEGRGARTDKPVVGVASCASYLAAIESEAGALDPVVRQYLAESNVAFEQHLVLAATFMLGAASERALYILAAGIERLLADSKQSERLARLSRAREVKEWVVEPSSSSLACATASRTGRQHSQTSRTRSTRSSPCIATSGTR
jgi:hypothetical protein